MYPASVQSPVSLTGMQLREAQCPRVVQPDGQGEVAVGSAGGPEDQSLWGFRMALRC